MNQQPVTKDFMRRACAYVQQDDCFIGSLTVKEHLVFNVRDRASKWPITLLNFSPSRPFYGWVVDTVADDS